MDKINFIFGLISLATIFAAPQEELKEVPDDTDKNSILNLVQVHYNLTEDVNNSILSTTVKPATTLESSLLVEELTTVEPEPFNDTCGCVCGVPNRKQRIVGGHVTKPNEFPWVVAMYKRGRFYCGGTLITRRHVLTAAHCVLNINMKEVRVTLGEHDRISKVEAVTEERRVKAASFHENFTLMTFNHDIAVLELDSPVELGSTIRTACIPQKESENYTGSVAIVAGWGRVDEKKPTSSTLRKVSVPVMSKTECLKAGYPKSRITENMICAGYSEGKKDACQGDSGGPLHIDGEKGSLEVIGIVSWGRGCARPNYPGVYTRVANYLSWVEDRLEGECMCSPPR